MSDIVQRLSLQRAKAGNSQWILSFIDLTALLLTFFVLLYATQSPNTSRMQALQASVQQRFQSKNMQPQSQTFSQQAASELPNFNDLAQDNSQAAFDPAYVQSLLKNLWAELPTAWASQIEVQATPHHFVLQVPANIAQQLPWWQALARFSQRLGWAVVVQVPTGLNDLPQQLALASQLHNLQAQAGWQVLPPIIVAGHAENVLHNQPISPFIDVVLTFAAQ